MFDPTAKAKCVVDIVFLVDATGGMQPLIDGLRAMMGRFFSGLDGDRNVRVDWRARVVGFRDYKEDGAEHWLEEHAFTKDVAELERQLGTLCAQWGGVLPESLLDAIWTVASGAESEDRSGGARPNEWRERHAARRVIIAFTDTPFKEPMSAPGCAGGTKEDVRGVLESRRIMLTLVGQKCPGDSCFLWAGTMSKGQYIPVDSLEDFGNDNVEMDKLLTWLGKTLQRQCMWVSMDDCETFAKDF